MLHFGIAVHKICHKDCAHPACVFLQLLVIFSERFIKNYHVRLDCVCVRKESFLHRVKKRKFDTGMCEALFGEANVFWRTGDIENKMSMHARRTRRPFCLMGSAAEMLRRTLRGGSDCVRSWDLGENILNCSYLNWFQNVLARWPKEARKTW